MNERKSFGRYLIYYALDNKIYLVLQPLGPNPDARCPMST